MKTKFLAFILSAILFACHSNPANTGDLQSTSSLSGKWLWTRSAGGFSGQIIGPAPDTRVIHTYTIDGSFFRYRNDTLQFSTHYTIRKGKTIYSRDSLDVIIFEDSAQNQQVVLQLAKDSLTLGDNYYDGYWSAFIRTN